MIYLKLFESESSDIQFEEVDSIFAEFTDNEEFGSINNKNEAYIDIELYKSTLGSSFDSINEIDSIINDYKDCISLFERLKVALSRVDHFDYQWTLELNDDIIRIKILRESRDINLYDAFGGIRNMRRVEEGIMKRLMKKVYNLDYSSSSYRPSTSGYYGKRAELLLYFNNRILMPGYFWRPKLAMMIEF